MPYLKVQEGDLFYQLYSRGSPVVFVGDWVLSHRYWGPTISLLSRGRLCVAYDPRGVGRSGPLSPHASFAIESHAEDLHQLIASLAQGYVDVVGHGLGGIVAALCMRKHPQDFRSLTLVATDLNVQEAHDELVKHAQSLIVLRKLASVPFLRRLVLGRYSLGRLAEGAKDLLTRDISRMDPKPAWEMLATALEEETLNQFISAMSASLVPVMLVACGEDKIAPSGRMRRVYDQMARGRFVTIHPAGHFPMLECPEQFAKILEDFYKTVEG